MTITVLLINTNESELIKQTPKALVGKYLPYTLLTANGLSVHLEPYKYNEDVLKQLKSSAQYKSKIIFATQDLQEVNRIKDAVHTFDIAKQSIVLWFDSEDTMPSAQIDGPRIISKDRINSTPKDVNTWDKLYDLADQAPAPEELFVASKRNGEFLESVFAQLKTIYPEWHVLSAPSGP